MSTALARLLGTDETRVRQVEAALLFAEARHGQVVGETVMGLLPPGWQPGQLELLLLELKAQGALRECGRDGQSRLLDRYTVDPDRLRIVMRTTPAVAQALAERERTLAAAATSIRVVATLPPGFTLPRGTKKPPSLVSVLHDLSVKADHNLVIMNPFFESNGLQVLHGALVEAARRGVAITVISRDLQDEQSWNRSALRELWDQLAIAGVADRLAVYNYELQDQGRTLLTLHAKVLIADKRLAYVGSANLTQHGLERHLEIGVRLEGAEVGVLEAVVTGLLQSGAAHRIEL